MNITVMSSTELVVTNDNGGSQTPASHTDPKQSINETLTLYMLCSGSDIDTCQNTTGPYWSYIGAPHQHNEVTHP